MEALALPHKSQKGVGRSPSAQSAGEHMVVPSRFLRTITRWAIVSLGTAHSRRFRSAFNGRLSACPRHVATRRLRSGRPASVAHASELLLGLSK